MNGRAEKNMNTFTVLSGFTNEQLTAHIVDSSTWGAFKEAVGLPKSRRQDAIKAYLAEHNIDYSSLPETGGRGRQANSQIWQIPEETFAEHVGAATSWIELLELCGCEGFGSIGSLRNRIRELGLNFDHLKGSRGNIPPENVFTANVRVTKGVLLRLLLEERPHKCEKCMAEEWMDVPVPLDVVHLNKKPRDNRKENLQLQCLNCEAVSKVKRS